MTAVSGPIKGKEESEMHSLSLFPIADDGSGMNHRNFWLMKEIMNKISQSIERFGGDHAKSSVREDESRTG
jgi:hypothetical protein